MNTEVEPITGDVFDEIVLLSRQGVLELIHSFLHVGSIQEATELSHLLASAPAQPWEVPHTSEPREYLGHYASENREHCFEASRGTNLSSAKVEPFAGACDDPEPKTLHLVTLTSRPGLYLGNQPVPFSNRHVLPLLAYLCARGAGGATVAEIGRDLFPELRGERLRNRIKNARVEFREAINAAIQKDPIGFDALSNLSIVSVGGTRSMILYLETGELVVQWDVRCIEQALLADASDWVRLLPTHQGEFLEGYELDSDENWVQGTREGLRSKLLERAAHVVVEWFGRGQFEQLRSLVSRLLAQGILDPVSPLADLISAYEVRAVAALSGKAEALAVWTAHATRFHTAFVDSPELEAVHPNRTPTP